MSSGPLSARNPAQVRALSWRGQSAESAPTADPLWETVLGLRTVSPRSGPPGRRRKASTAVVPGSCLSPHACLRTGFSSHLDGGLSSGTRVAHRGRRPGRAPCGSLPSITDPAPQRRPSARSLDDCAEHLGSAVTVLANRCRALRNHWEAARRPRLLRSRSACPLAPRPSSPRPGCAQPPQESAEAGRFLPEVRRRKNPDRRGGALPRAAQPEGREN